MKVVSTRFVATTLPLVMVQVLPYAYTSLIKVLSASFVCFKNLL